MLNVQASIVDLVLQDKNFPTFETCSHEANFGKKEVNGTKIVGGVNANENQWPFITRLTVQFSTGQGLCGGTIIDKNWVLTAAHCCDGAHWIRATFGDLRFSSADSKQYTRSANKIVKHPKYNSYNMKYDVCLLQFSEDIIAADPDHDVRAACLTADLPEHGSNCWIAGWGTTSSGGSISDPLLQANVKLMDKSYCLAHSNIPSYALQKEMICAGKLDDDNNGETDGGVDSCQGDSGGPLICEIDGKAALTGVVSWGVGCGDQGWPGVYSSAAYSRTNKWIKRTVQPKGNIFNQFYNWLLQLF